METQNTPQTVATSAAAAGAGCAVNVRAPYLFKALSACALAMSSDPTRYVLNGLYLEYKNRTGLLSVCGTDGRRLHLLQIKVAGDRPEKDLSAILAAATVKQWIAFAPLRKKERKNEMRMIQVCFDGEKVRLSHPDGTLEARAVQANYPNFRQVIPKDSAAWQIGLEFPEIEKGVADFEKAEKEAIAAGVAACNREGMPGRFTADQVDRLEKRVLKDTRERFDAQGFFGGHSVYFTRQGIGYFPTVPTFNVLPGNVPSGRGAGFDRMDKPKDATATAFNPVYLADFIKSAELVNGPRLAGAFNLRMKDGKSPAAFICGLDDVLSQDMGAAFVIMPQRIA